METPLAQQSPDDVFAKEELIVAFVQEAFPSLDLSPGTVLRDIVIKLYAHLETRIQEKIDIALISGSLLEISKNPALIDDIQLERVLANYNVTRSEGATATGKLRLFLSSTQSVLLLASSVITINNVQFNPVQTFLLLPEDLYTGDSNQRLITPSGSVYTATIDITAVNPGSTGNIKAGSLLNSINPTPSSVISGRADSDFIGGLDADDNQVLLDKMKTGVVGKVFGGREHIKAKLKTQFPGVIDVGCVGFLDPEMKRDLVNGVHSGGRVDVFVKSAGYPSRIQEHVTPDLVGLDSVNQQGIFEFQFSADQSPGLYTVESIRAYVGQGGSYELQDDTRTYRNLGNHYVSPDFRLAFSAFQSVKIKFAVPFAGMLEAWAGTGSKPTYEQVAANIANYKNAFKFYIEYLTMPNLKEIQSYIDLASERSLSADMMVYAPVPVMCSLQLRLIKKAGAPDFNANAVKSAIVSKFNSYSMGEPIPGSALIHIAYENLPDGYSVDLPIHMYGVVINPDLSKDVMFSSDALRPPNNSLKAVSPKNVAFFLETSMIDISVREC